MQGSHSRGYDQIFVKHLSCNLLNLASLLAIAIVSFFAGAITDLIGGIIALKSRPITAFPSGSGLYCSSTSNAVTTRVDVYPTSTFAFYFVNATHPDSPISVAISRSFSATETVPVSQSLTAAEFALGLNLTLTPGMTLTIQCDASMTLTGIVTGCALNNRYEMRVVQIKLG